MSLFQDINITWDGVEYTIPSNRVMRVIGIVENHVTLKELHEMTQVRHTLKLAQIAEGFAAVLQYLGVKSKDKAREGLPINAEEVYGMMFDGVGLDRDLGIGSQAIISSVTALLALMTPPEHFMKQQMAATGGASGKPLAVTTPKTNAVKSSRKRTKRQLAGGSSLTSSGLSPQ